MGHLLFLNRVKDKFESDTRKTVVESIALSVMNYCLPVYGTTNATLLRRVQQLQNFAAKICAGGARRSDHATPFTDQLQWLKIDKKVCFDLAIHVFKVKMKLFPSGTCTSLHTAKFHTRTTRHDTKTNYTYHSLTQTAEGAPSPSWAHACGTLCPHMSWTPHTVWPKEASRELPQEQ